MFVLPFFIREHQLEEYVMPILRETHFEEEITDRDKETKIGHVFIAPVINFLLQYPHESDEYRNLIEWCRFYEQCTFGYFEYIGGATKNPDLASILKREFKNVYHWYVKCRCTSFPFPAKPLHFNRPTVAWAKAKAKRRPVTCKKCGVVGHRRDRCLTK